MSLAVRSDLEQKLSAKVDTLAVASSITTPETMLAVENGAPEDRFVARIAEKSKTLATTRERLDSALALDVQVEGTAVMSLSAVLTTDENIADVSGSEPSATLFLAKQPATLVATSSATTTATTSSEVSTTTTPASPAARFFAPFMKQ